MSGFLILVIALAAASAFGLYRAASDGRFSGTRAVRGADSGAPRGAGDGDSSDAAATDDQAEIEDDRRVITAEDLGEQLGERVTLVQFSSAFCAPCRAARRVLGEVAAERDGVRHVEVDAESHLELVREVGVMRTPTTLVLDAAGREVSRASGAPTKAQVNASLEPLLAT